jgi:hypothetical protein
MKKKESQVFWGMKKEGAGFLDQHPEKHKTQMEDMEERTRVF